MATQHSRWLLAWRTVSAVGVAMMIATAFSQEKPASQSLRPSKNALPTVQPVVPLRSVVEGEATTDTDQPQPMLACIVLGDGRVFEGEVSELAAGYRVVSKKGTLILPFSEVRTVAESLPQAYEQLRDSYRNPSAGDHIDLGWWCQQNELFEEASAEAQAALVLEPTRKEAQSLLKKAATALGLEEAPAPLPPQNMPVRPLAGGAVVSVATQVEFSRHVQRLALNKCGNGSCHGASSLSPFKIQQNVHTDVNLKEVLSYIDSENPEQSPLLVRARTADGPHNGLFRGSSGTEQYNRLMAWVVQAAKDQNNAAAIHRRPQVWREGGPRVSIRPRSAQPELADGEESLAPGEMPPAEALSNTDIETVAGTAEAKETPVAIRAPRTPRTAPLQSDVIRKLLEDQAPDPFDPEEFNRMVHGYSQP